uniref:Uncharacterized protein NT02AP0016 n=1 Tax=Alvinella pompejana epibiont 6C6 TaxID=244799 RepID=Q6W3P2_9BACT|nr:hypothetical protein [Alvinella pompejana epibiont 6C6]
MISSKDIYLSAFNNSFFSRLYLMVLFLNTLYPILIYTTYFIRIYKSCQAISKN